VFIRVFPYGFACFASLYLHQVLAFSSKHRPKVLMQNVNPIIAAALAPYAPADTDPTMQALVDQYGSIDSQIKALTESLNMLKKAIKAQGAGVYTGDIYKLNVFATPGRETTDWRAVAEHFNPSYQLITAHTTKSPVGLTIAAPAMAKKQVTA
jgi:hypothetical protein